MSWNRGTQGQQGDIPPGKGWVISEVAHEGKKAKHRDMAALSCEYCALNVSLGITKQTSSWKRGRERFTMRPWSPF